jgi:uncharacterized protein (DUF924 family)
MLRGVDLWFDSRISDEKERDRYYQVHATLKRLDGIEAVIWMQEPQVNLGLLYLMDNMSDSNKSRHGTLCKRWKDTVLASRSQARAWSKRKQIRSQQERARSKATMEKES